MASHKQQQDLLDKQQQDLLDKQQQDLLEKIYSFIKEYKKTKSVAPTLEEIRQAMEFKSVGRVDRYLDQLDSQGLIVYPASIHRGITLEKDDFFEDVEPISNMTQQDNSICIEGIIAAGLPIEKFTEPEQKFIRVGSRLAREGTYALIVKGESMIKDHICDGDYVIIRRQSTYQDGDIIVATHKLDGLMGSGTLKHFYFDKRKKLVYLKPANDNVETIVISKKKWKQEWENQGKLLAVLRPHEEDLFLKDKI